MKLKLLIYQLFSLLPLKKKKILFFSYYGAQYGGSPKYISEYIQSQNQDWEIVWSLNDFTVLPDANIKKVKFASLRFFYELATAKVFLTNFRLPSYIKKRRSQLYIQTWHSSLRLKMIEKDAQEDLPAHYIEMAKSDSKKIDCLLSGCEDSKRIFQQSFWYDGVILDIGTPRIDPLIQLEQSKLEQIKKGIGLAAEDKVLLYAPTFRKGDNTEMYIKQFDFIVEELNKKWLGDWKVLARLHPHLMNKAEEVFLDENIIHVSKYPDIQELLMITDFLITDYSSLMFDFLYTQKPVLLYLPDLEYYLANERALYYQMDELPFLKAYDNMGIKHLLDNFDEELYKKALAQFIIKIGSFETGRASAQLLNILNQKIND